MVLENIQYLDHVTDAHVRVMGKNLNESFEYSAKALVNIMFNIELVEKRQKFQINAEGDELENLLFDWLDKVLLLMLIDKVVLSDFNVGIVFIKDLNKYTLTGYGKGESIDLDKHDLKVEIKGITYHQMKITKCSNKEDVVIEYIVDL